MLIFILALKFLLGFKDCPFLPRAKCASLKKKNQIVVTGPSSPNITSEVQNTLNGPLAEAFFSPPSPLHPNPINSVSCCLQYLFSFLYLHHTGLDTTLPCLDL